MIHRLKKLKRLDELNIFSILILLIKAKWIFKKPKSKKVLIYDSESVRNGFATYFFKRDSYEVFDVRYESINVYILLTTLLKSKLKNFIDNYKTNFIKTVSPKIVFTGIDNTPAFYNLKNLCKEPIYISAQNGIRDNIFFQDCKKYIKKKKIKLRADHIFVFGSNDKNKLSKIIKGNFHIVGNATNNQHFVNSKKNIKKVNSMMYISQYTIDDKTLFNYLIKFCSKRKIKLFFCSKAREIDFQSAETYYRNTLEKGNWVYLPRISRSNSYRNLNKQQMIVFQKSTMGWEGFAKGLRCACFRNNFPTPGVYKKYPRSGIFWHHSKSYQDVEKTLKRVLRFSNRNWAKIVQKYSSEIMTYDPNNTKIKKIIKKTIIKN